MCSWSGAPTVRGSAAPGLRRSGAPALRRPRAPLLSRGEHSPTTTRATRRLVSVRGADTPGDTPTRCWRVFGQVATVSLALWVQPRGPDATVGLGTQLDLGGFPAVVARDQVDDAARDAHRVVTEALVVARQQGDVERGLRVAVVTVCEQ